MRFRASLDFSLEANTAEEAADILDDMVAAIVPPPEAGVTFEASSYPVPVVMRAEAQ